jgi:hypothetical protein
VEGDQSHVTRKKMTSDGGTERWEYRGNWTSDHLVPPYSGSPLLQFPAFQVFLVTWLRLPRLRKFHANRI